MPPVYVLAALRTTVPPVPFSVMASPPLRMLLKVMVLAVLARVKEPDVKPPVPDIVRFCVPLMVAAPPTVKLLARLAVRLDCRLPPFRARAPVPNPFVAEPTCNVPVVLVTVPVYEPLAPETMSVPVAVELSVSDAAPLNAPLKVVVLVLVSVNVLPVMVPAPLNVMALVPPIVVTPFTV